MDSESTGSSSRYTSSFATDSEDYGGGKAVGDVEAEMDSGSSGLANGAGIDFSTDQIIGDRGQSKGDQFSETAYPLSAGGSGILGCQSAWFKRPVFASFDSIDNSLVDGYAGLDWTNQGVFVPGPDFGGYSKLYDFEGDGVSLNSGGYPSSARSMSSDFDFITGEFAAAWSNDLNFEVRAFDNDKEVGLARFVLDQRKAIINFKSKFAFGSDSAMFSGRFTSIDTVTFTSSGGTSPENGTQVGMDNWLLAYERIC